MCAQNLRHCVNSSRYGTAWVPDDLRIPHATVVAVDIGKWIQWVATIIFHNQRRETTRRETSSKRLRKISPYVTGVLNTHVYMLNFADHACPYHPKSSESPRYGTRWRWSLARRRASGSRRDGPEFCGLLWPTLWTSMFHLFRRKTLLWQQLIGQQGSSIRVTSELKWRQHRDQSKMVGDTDHSDGIRPIHGVIWFSLETSWNQRFPFPMTKPDSSWPWPGTCGIIPTVSRTTPHFKIL